MKKEVLVKPRGKDFLEFFKEKVECKVAWVYIDQPTIISLVELGGMSYMDIDTKLHIPYGNIVVDGFKDSYKWYRISSIDSNTISYKAPADPDEFLFITMKD